jgi:hypothetical protein
MGKAKQDPPEGSTNVTSSVRVITPPVAQELLGRMSHNRPLKQAKVNAYKQDMASGRWAVNGEAIILDETGAPINGQHRLTACIQAAVPFTTLVVEGVPRASMATIDTGAPRSYRDVVSLRGGNINLANVLASAARLWVKYQEDEVANTNRLVSHTEIDLTLQGVPQLITSAEYITTLAKVKTFCYPSVQTVIHALMAQDDGIGGEMADLFMSELNKGAGLEETNPIYLLRRRLVERERGDRRPLQHEVLGLTIKAVNAWLEGHRLQVLVWRQAEGTPRLGRITPGQRYNRKKRGQVPDAGPMAPEPPALREARLAGKGTAGRKVAAAMASQTARNGVATVTTTVSAIGLP